jgi:DNA-binding Lrp family transcriptional regulator
VNGFLNYSFGWKPLINDLRAIAKELRSFPSTVRKRLKQLGDGSVVRHYKFDLSDTVNDLNTVYADYSSGTYTWNNYHRELKTTSKSRSIVVTIRAKVKPKLTGEGQDTLNKLGSLGLIPSLATVWSITKLSFVVDWFFNIGGAIENLQGSLTHDISDVTVCVSDSRRRILTTYFEGLGGSGSQAVALEHQKYYNRYQTTVPVFPVFNLPTQPMQYALLGLLALTTTKNGDIILNSVDKYDKLTPKVASKIISSIKSLHQSNIDALMKLK